MNPAADPAHSELRVLFTTAVWGADYVERFLKYSLRTQLSAGNLGYFNRSSLFLLITDAESIKHIRSSPIYKKLADLVSVEFVDIERFSAGHSNKYSLLTACQNYALERSVEFDAIFFGYGDALWSDGSYRAAANRLTQGHDAVFSFGYPVLDKPFKAEIEKRDGDPLTAEASIAPRDFARMVYQHLHPMAHANRWDRKVMSHCPSYVLWDAPDQGLLVRAFHLHPVALRVQKYSPYFFAPFRSTLDEEFVGRLNRTNPRIYVCPSSDEIGVCSLAEATDLAYRMDPPRPVSLNELANFAETYAGMVHRLLFNRSIRLVIDDVVESKWQPIEDEAAAVDRDIKQLLSTPDSVLALENPAGFSARLLRQNNYQHWHDWGIVLNGLDLMKEKRKTRIPRGKTKQASEPPEQVYSVAISRSSIAVAAGFARNFQSMVFRSDSAGVRNVASRSLMTTMKILHAVKITRVIRVSILPMLPVRLQMRVYESAYRLGAIGLRTPHQAPTEHIGLFPALIKWLKQALRFRL